MFIDKALKHVTCLSEEINLPFYFFLSWNTRSILFLQFQQHAPSSLIGYSWMVLTLRLVVSVAITSKDVWPLQQSLKSENNRLRAQGLFKILGVIPIVPVLILSCLYSVFGISPIIQSNCSNTWKLTVHPQRKWYHFVNPIMLLILYYTLATLIRLWLQEPIDQLMVRTADPNSVAARENRTFYSFIFTFILSMWNIWPYESWQKNKKHLFNFKINK